jgi:predicted hotdog family 3-hydroxylacyl-ACP dehydratase
MAIHGALVGGAATTEGARVGYLASVRGVSLFADRLDDVQSDLIATASRVTSDTAMALYEFSVASAERILLSGRATIVFIP